MRHALLWNHVIVPGACSAFICSRNKAVGMACHISQQLGENLTADLNLASERHEPDTVGCMSTFATAAAAGGPPVMKDACRFL
jgi:hypothetical protein